VPFAGTVGTVFGCTNDERLPAALYLIARAICAFRGNLEAAGLATEVERIVLWMRVYDLLLCHKCESSLGEQLAK